MEKRDVTRFGVMVAVVIVLAVLASFALLFFGNRNPEVTLPPISTAAPATEAPQADDGFQLVAVTPATVQNVIATLKRPASYTRTVTVEQFWTDPEAESGTASASAASQIWVDGNWTRTDLTLPGGQVRSVIVEASSDGPGQLWSWESGRQSWYEGTADERDADLAQWCPTYEDVLDLPPDCITDAGYEKKNDTSCIYAEVSDRELGYRRIYWVSVENGLLMAAEIWDGEMLVYQMSGAQSAELEAGAVFQLPDGTVLHELDLIDQEREPGQE